jgi:hypothetical protein
MKKVCLLTMFALITTGAIVSSCTKNDAVSQEIQNPEKLEHKLIAQEIISYSIPEKDLTKELETLMMEKSSGNYQFNSMQISHFSTSKKYDISIFVDIDLDDTPAKIACKGSGLSFANSVGDWLKEHPTTGLKITYDEGTETFTADDNC